MNTPNDTASTDSMPKFSALAQALGGRFEWQRSGTYRWVSRFDLCFEDTTIVVLPATGSKGALVGADLHVRVERAVVSAGTTLSRESALDRLGKRLRINREFQTGDAAFDELVYVDSPAEDAELTRLFESPSVRSAITRMLDRHRGLAVLLQFTAGSEAVAPSVPRGVTVRLRAGDFGEHARVREVVQSLVDLAKAYDREGAIETGPYGRAGGRRASAAGSPLTIRWGRVTAVLLVLALQALYTIAAPPDRTLGGTAVSYGLALGLVLWGLSFVVLVLLFRGRSSSLSTVFGFTFLALVSFPFCIVLSTHLDTLLDAGPPSTYEGTAHYQPQSKGPGFVVVRADWLPGKPTSHYREPFALFRSEGDVPVRVVVRPGAFGVPWVVSISR